MYWYVGELGDWLGKIYHALACGQQHEHDVAGGRSGSGSVEGDAIWATPAEVLATLCVWFRRQTNMRHRLRPGHVPQVCLLVVL
jgi:hypothetical protein